MNESHNAMQSTPNMLPGAYGPASSGYLNTGAVQTSLEELEAARATAQALWAREQVEQRLYTTTQALLAYGNDEDVAAAAAAIAKVAAKAMRRR